MFLIQRHFALLPSTNDWMKSYLSRLTPDQLFLVSAAEQTAGRGQYGRSWLSPKDKNIYASFGFLAPLENSDPLFYTRLLAREIQGVLETLGVPALLKWPNDLLVNGKKIAGILCETTPLEDWGGIVVGWGMNINMEESDLASIDQPATSLWVETKERYLVNDLLILVAERFILTISSALGTLPPFSPLHTGVIT